jgi:hypothetical protein
MRCVRQSLSRTGLYVWCRCHLIDDVPARMYSPAKTVADFFKFRNKIGLDVAIEALREALRAKLCTREELWAAAKACRVSTVIRPYIEAM